MHGLVGVVNLLRDPRGGAHTRSVRSARYPCGPSDAGHAAVRRASRRRRCWRRRPSLPNANKLIPAAVTIHSTRLVVCAPVTACLGRTSQWGVPPAIIDAVEFGLSRPTNMMFVVAQDFRDQLLASPLYGSESLAREFLTNLGVILSKDRERSGESQLAETAAGSASSSGSQSGVCREPPWELCCSP